MLYGTRPDRTSRRLTGGRVLALAFLLPCVLVAGCADDGDSADSTPDAGVGADAGADGSIGDADPSDAEGSDAGASDAGSSDAQADEPAFDEGAWAVRLAFNDLGGIEARFEWTFSDVSVDRVGRVEFRGLDAQGESSDVLATAEDIAITDDAFTIEFDTFTLPAAYSPTNAEIDLSASVEAEIAERDFVCGVASGTIETFGISFSRTTFGAVAPDAPDAPNPPLSCDRSTGGETAREIVTVGPEERPASLELPADAGDAVRPIVMVLHGRSAAGQIQADYFGLRTLQEEFGYLLLIPEGTTASDGGQFWNATDECCDSDGTGVDDLGYLLGLVDEVQSDHNGGDLYLVGHSNGGWMSHRIACDRPERVAGLLALAGSSYSDEADCMFEGSAAVVLAHGTSDATVPYEGIDTPEFSYPGARLLAERWASRLGCDATPEPGVLRDYETTLDGDETTVETWADCGMGSALALWTIDGGAHIPGIDAVPFVGDALRFLGVAAP